MSKIGAWVLSPVLFLAVVALDAQILPDAESMPEVDTITPVPPPEIPFGGGEALMPGLPENLKINNFGREISYDSATGLFRWGGPVKVTGDNGLEIFADSAVVDTKEEKVTLEGDVSIYQGNILQRGDRAVYFYERNFLDTAGLRVSLDPILLEAGQFTVEERGGKRVYVGQDAGITTHDVENPNYWVRAAETTIYPDDRIVFKNLKLYAGGIPIFWLPYLSQPLDSELGYHFVPGSRTSWGPYLLNSYGIMLGGKRNPETGENEDAWLLSQWRFDIMSRRGTGLGVDLRDTRQDVPSFFSGLGLYYLNDLEPNLERAAERPFPVNEDRYGIALKTRTPLGLNDGGKWRLDSNLNLLSDEYYLEDFDPTRYRNDPAPDNTLGLYRRDDRSLLSFLARLRLNDFYRTDTRLPEIAFDMARAPVLGSPLLHEGSSSFGILGARTSDRTRRDIIDPLLSLPAGDPRARRLLNELRGYEREIAARILSLSPGDPRREALRTQLVDPGFARFHTYQELSLPMTLGGFLNFTPQAGAGYTRYEAVDGPVDAFDRSLLHVGTETSLKFSKDLGAFEEPGIGLDGLIHVLQPYASWSVVSTDGSESDFRGVDRLTVTTRPRTLDPVRYTAIDDFRSWNTIRLGTRNRLLTRRDGQSFEWLYMNTFIDHFIDDPEGNRNFSNLYNDIRWSPLPWMAVDLETQFPMVSGGSDFNEFNARLRFLPTPNMDVSVGYRFLDDHPVLLDSNRVDLRFYTRLTENWGVGTQHIVELDDGTLELQQYTVHRDFGNWVAGLGITQRDNRIRNEYGVVLSFTLKDFPSATLPFKIDAE